MNPTYFRFAQIGLSALILVFSIAVIGTASHSLDVFNKQHDSNPWWAPIWSDHFDTNGTKGLIGAAVTVMILQTIYIVLSFLPSLHLADRPTFRAALTLATVLPGALLTAATVILAHVLNHNAPDVDTIQTWTCRFGDDDGAKDLDIPASESNAGFARVCTESRFAHGTSLTIFLLQLVMLGLTIVCWVADQWAKRRENKEWQDASSLEMNAQGAQSENERQQFPYGHFGEGSVPVPKAYGS